MIKIENGSNLPSVFTFGEKNQVRIINNNQPWFAATDICKTLGIKNTSKVIERLDDDERYKFNIGRQGETWFVNESGLYNLIFRSDKPEAKLFRKWVTNEVLPQLRQTGNYGVAEKQLELSGGNDLVSLINDASIITGSMRQLAAKIGISASTLSNYVTGSYIQRPELTLSSKTIGQIELRCKNIINNTNNVEIDTVEMLLSIDDRKVRLGLWNKLRNGGAA